MQHIARPAGFGNAFLQIGAIKLEWAVYAEIVDGLYVNPGHGVFIEHALQTDIKGPQAADIRATRVGELSAATLTSEPSKL